MVEFPDQVTVISDKTGESVILEKWKPNKFTQFLQRLWGRFGNKNCTSFTVFQGEDKIGELDLEHISDEELHLEWILLDYSVQGKGIGSAIIKSIIQFAAENGYKEITLEAPIGKTQRILGTSENVQKFYELLGFSLTGNNKHSELLEMRLDLTK